MTASAESLVFGAFLVFCRLGGCLMIAPGLSSVRIAMSIRLLTAWAICVAITPLVADQVAGSFVNLPKPQWIYLIMSEIMTGISIGLIARIYLLVLQVAGTAASAMIGLAGIPGIPLEEADTGSPLATLAVTSGTVAVFAAGLHIELIRALIESYQTLPPGDFPNPGHSLDELVRRLHDTSLLALRLAAPFIVYAVVVNVALGFANRFAQQVSVYQTTTGIVLLLGILLLQFVWPEWMTMFIDSYRDWLVGGSP